MRAFLALVAVSGLLALTGCVGDEPMPSLPPTPSAESVFESEEEALAAAEEAYAAYLDMSNLIASEGGADPERIAPFVTGGQIENEEKTYEYYRINGLHAAGPVTADSISLQQLSQDGSDAQVTIYLCLDASQARLLDSTGTDVTPDDRPERAGFEVTLSGSESLRVARSEPWAGESFC